VERSDSMSKRVRSEKDDSIVVRLSKHKSEPSTEAKSQPTSSSIVSKRREEEPVATTNSVERSDSMSKRVHSEKDDSIVVRLSKHKSEPSTKAKSQLTSSSVVSKRREKEPVATNSVSVSVPDMVTWPWPCSRSDNHCSGCSVVVRSAVITKVDYASNSRCCGRTECLMLVKFPLGEAKTPNNKRRFAAWGWFNKHHMRTENGECSGGRNPHYLCTVHSVRSKLPDDSSVVTGFRPSDEET